jgi:hypothetical protein
MIAEMREAFQRRSASSTARSGVPPRTLRRVTADVEARLKIASPQFLERYRTV